MTKQELSKRQAVARIEEAITAPLPSDDDFQIYCEITINGRPQKSVAAEFGLSTSQLQHLLVRVARWMKLDPLPESTRYAVGTHLERLEQQWRMVMAAWHRSCEDEELTKTTVEHVVKAKTQTAKEKRSGTGVSPVTNGGNRRDAGSTESGSTDAGSTDDSQQESQPPRDEKRKLEQTKKRGAGDVRYLEQARKIMAEIRQLTAQAQSDHKKQKQQEETDVESLDVAQRCAEATHRIVQIRRREAQREDADQ